MHRWRSNSWIHTFHNVISVMWNANGLIQDLNLSHSVHFLGSYNMVKEETITLDLQKYNFLKFISRKSLKETVWERQGDGDIQRTAILTLNLFPMLYFHIQGLTSSQRRNIQPGATVRPLFHPGVLQTSWLPNYGSEIDRICCGYPFIYIFTTPASFQFNTCTCFCLFTKVHPVW